MKATEIIEKVGGGVLDALRTNDLFLGVEEFSHRNADIHPECITTVKVGERLTGVDRVVALEVGMTTLRKNAAEIARRKSLKHRETAWPKIQSILDASDYEFGKKRIDILVRLSSGDRPPLLMAEAKLGVKNVAGITKDIDRIVNLFEMYHALDLLSGHDTYGVVVFHAMQEKGTAATLPTYASNLLKGIDGHIRGLRPRSALHFKAGLLSATLVEKPVSGYLEEHEDGSVEGVFEKDQFSFQAGLVLIGNADDVLTVAL